MYPEAGVLELRSCQAREVRHRWIGRSVRQQLRRAKRSAIFSLRICLALYRGHLRRDDRTLIDRRLWIAEKEEMGEDRFHHCRAPGGYVVSCGYSGLRLYILVSL